MKNSLLGIVLLFTFIGTAQQKDSPKLIVGIVVDQMCYEYLYRYYGRFGKEGFVKLMENGTHCRNANYNYVPTYTGPGHASIYTGATPSDHGIVANEWFDRASGKSVNCVEDTTTKTIGSDSEFGEFSPRRLKSNTITDQLKMTYPESKVISVSIKNRGAILPGGHLSDGSYWYDYASGKFITSDFYTSKLPDWVTTFNAEGRVDKWLTQTWNPLYELSTYKASGPDDSPYEYLLTGKQQPTFPYDLKQMTATPGSHPYSLFTYTPFANTYLTDFAIKAIEQERLGKDEQSDMLCISYSTPDIAGHAFGPYAVEIEDMYLRLDQDLANLVKYLETSVGKGEYTLFVTADHGVVPVPQYLIDNKLPGGYFFLDNNLSKLRNMLIELYGKDLILEQDNLNLYLDNRSIAALGINKAELVQMICSEIRTWDHVKRVFTAEDLEKGSRDDRWSAMIAAGYHPRESGDIIFMLEPGYLPKSYDSENARKGTSHGSAFSYDTHVPLLWYGKGIPVQEVFRRVDITAIAATLTHLLNLQNPNVISSDPILELLGN